MTQLELKKLQVEYHKVYAARLDLELRVEQFQDDIRRIQEGIEIQLKKEAELQEKINQAKAAQS